MVQQRFPPFPEQVKKTLEMKTKSASFLSCLLRGLAEVVTELMKDY